MSIEERRKRSERISQWEELMRKFAQSHKEECRVYSLAIPRVERSEKRFPTGSTYCGTWDVLGMSGDVKYTFPNGAIYQGQFEDGMFHGEGILKYPSGIKLRTKWKRGELVEKTLVYSDGSEYKPDSSYCVLPDRRAPSEYEQKWIVENCRKSPMLPVGPRKDLYEEWVEPPQVLKRCKCACPNCIQE
ncbi:uncharacterized protein LOC121733675 isoform X3 [Aricia agestis]|uniref:uncharacterized protein LOC121733675 isoform X3 n=1 Tax=Aricia agestis TaxID=91739 RepID=UPI001C209853|nr:uncharacterized protein LOC121733675 isoform X3 [Aricia agestis]